jgi:recombinational DNA repair protein RecR
MTNSEMIQKLETDGLSSVSDMEFITNALEENTKLKAEIERLKSELEQIEKSFQSSCETCNYEYDLHPCDVCKLKDKWKLKGKV